MGRYFFCSRSRKKRVNTMWRPRVFNVFKHSKSVQVEKKNSFSFCGQIEVSPLKKGSRRDRKRKCGGCVALEPVIIPLRCEFKCRACLSVVRLNRLVIIFSYRNVRPMKKIEKRKSFCEVLPQLGWSELPFFFVVVVPITIVMLTWGYMTTATGVHRRWGKGGPRR